MGLGLVRHSHPLQGKLAALYEIGVHLMKRQEERERERWGENDGGRRERKGERGRQRWEESEMTN